MTRQETYRILFIGDVMGKPGREAISQHLPQLVRQHQPLFTIVNGENAAGGVGITPDIARELFNAGADVITLGNHAYHKKEVFEYLDQGHPIIRPLNVPSNNPGRGSLEISADGVSLLVINLCGRVFMEPYDDPFPLITEVVEESVTPHIFVDFHAEATSEKVAMGWHLDGKVTAVAGTHTHIPTADERVLPGGTAFITDVGMTGCYDSVLGMDTSIVLRKFRTSMPARFEVANGRGVICGVLINVQRLTGRAISIERVRKGDESASWETSVKS